MAGNPSDGYGGAVCSVTLPFFHAEVVVSSPQDGSPVPLLEATMQRFHIDVAPVPEVGLTFTSSIPQSVGLAGSSAIVISAIHALCNLVEVILEPDDVAALAHTVERVDLGIAGGWQDQLIQSRGRSGLMEFGAVMSHRPLVLPTEPPIPLYLAWSEKAAEPSGASHQVLRARANEIGAETANLASLARRAADAFESRDVHGLKEAINATYDIRREIMPISPSHAAMIETARSLGASANFAGSGGAIIGVLPKDAGAFTDAMERAGYHLVDWNAT